MNNNENVIEIVRLKVSAGNSIDFLQKRELVDVDLRKIAGFMGTELCQLDESNWVAFVRWSSREMATAAQAVAETLPSITNWIALADEFVSFESATVKYQVRSVN